MPNKIKSNTSNLFGECASRKLNVSITYQSNTDYSVGIYKRYLNTYSSIFYTDGHITRKKEVIKAL